MKRLIAAFALTAALPFAAMASPDLAGDWGIKAADLHAETSGLIETIDETGEAAITEDYEIEIARFATAATRLGRWIDGNDGPSDLGCIFRGMAEEGEVQLDALFEAETARETRKSLVRLAAMFSDAEVIAVAAAHSSDHQTPALHSGAASCPASGAAARAALK